MSETKQQFDQNGAFAKSFKSPFFLAIAACFSVIFIAVLIASLTTELGLGVILAVVFSGVATLCAWLLYATPVTKGKLIGFRLYIAYRKIMNTFAIVFVSIIGAILVVGCVVLGLMSDVIKDELIPMLESDVKPMLEEVVNSSEMLEEEFEDIRDISLRRNSRENVYADELVEMVTEIKDFAEIALEAWDDIIKVLETDFMSIAVVVAILYVIVIVAMCFISSAFKRTSKYIRALAEGKDADRKAPFIVCFIGGGFAAIGAVACMFFDPLMGISGLVTAAMPIVLAIFFKGMNEARKEEMMLAAVAVEEETEALAVEETVEE